MEKGVSERQEVQRIWDGDEAISVDMGDVVGGGRGEGGDFGESRKLESMMHLLRGVEGAIVK